MRLFCEKARPIRTAEGIQEFQSAGINGAVPTGGNGGGSPLMWRFSLGWLHTIAQLEPPENMVPLK
jgi:hypothetical protein